VLEDNSPSGISRREAMAEGMRRTEETLRVLETHFLALQNALPRNRLFRSVAEYLRRTPKRLAAQRATIAEPAYTQEASRAQAFDARVCRSFHVALYLGELYRLAREMGEEGRAEEMRACISSRMEQISAESEIRTIPLQQLVSLQVGSGLLAMQAGASG
jgi:hypothetical protein